MTRSLPTRRGTVLTIRSSSTGHLVESVEDENQTAGGGQTLDGQERAKGHAVGVGQRGGDDLLQIQRSAAEPAEVDKKRQRRRWSNLHTRTLHERLVDEVAAEG